MRQRNHLIFLFFPLPLLLLPTGCMTTGVTSKAPVNPILTGGTAQERRQEYTLKRIKWQHVGTGGKVLGNQYFTDASLPITGARSKDTLHIKQGLYEGRYTVTRVIRIRAKKKRQVILKIEGSFNSQWKTIHQGTGGQILDRKTFTDVKSFPPDVNIGTQLVLLGGEEPQRYTVEKTTVVKVEGTRLQRVAYVVEGKFPQKAKGLRYMVQTPAKNDKLPYAIYWRGSGLSGYNFTLGINRRRYGEKEMEALLKSDRVSAKRIQSTGLKQGSATILVATGTVTLIVGGFLALVRRDDFQGASQAIPWGIVGGGVVLIGISIPIAISGHNDYMRAAKAYNKSLLSKLRLEKPPEAPTSKKTARR